MLAKTIFWANEIWLRFAFIFVGDTDGSVLSSLPAVSALGFSC
jgi:hypothetical protein